MVQPLYLQNKTPDVMGAYQRGRSASIDDAYKESIIKNQAQNGILQAQKEERIAAKEADAAEQQKLETYYNMQKPLLDRYASDPNVTDEEFNNFANNFKSQAKAIAPTKEDIIDRVVFEKRGTTYVTEQIVNVTDEEDVKYLQTLGIREPQIGERYQMGQDGDKIKVKPYQADTELAKSYPRIDDTGKRYKVGKNVYLEDGTPLQERVYADGSVKNVNQSEEIGSKVYGTAITPDVAGERTTETQKAKEPFELRKEQRAAVRSKDYNRAKQGLTSIQVALGLIDESPQIYRDFINKKLGRGEAAKFDTAIKNAEDIITRIRTGAALNEDEQKFYDSLFTPGWTNEPETAVWKLEYLEDIFKETIRRQLYPTSEIVGIESLIPDKYKGQTESKAPGDKAESDPLGIL